MGGKGPCSGNLDTAATTSLVSICMDGQTEKRERKEKFSSAVVQGTNFSVGD